MKNNKLPHYLVAAALCLLILIFLKPTGSLTNVGVRVLAVFIPIIYLWITVNTDWVSLLGLGCLILTQAMTPTEVFAQSMGHSIIITIIVCMALNVCLTDTGVINKIANWFITRKIVEGRPYVFLGMFFLSYLVLAIFMETLSLTIIYITLATILVKEMGIEKGEPFYTCMFLGLLWVNAVGTVSSPISHALPLILIAAVQNQAGIIISFSTWMSVGIPFSLLSWVMMMLIIRFIWKPDATKYANYDIQRVRDSMQPLSLEGRVSAIVFGAVIFAWICPELISGIAPAASKYLNSVGSTIPPIIAVALLCVIRVHGKEIANFPHLVDSVPVGVLIFTAAVTVFGNAISLQSTGISPWLQELIGPATQNIPIFALVALIVIISLVMTNFISNTVTELLCFSVSVTLLMTSGLNLAALAILIGLTAGIGVLTPSAAVPSPLFFGPGHITVKSTARYNLCLIALEFAVAFLAIWPYAQMVVSV